MKSERLKNIPPYLFAELDELKAKKRASGADLIDLSVGDPDLKPPEKLIDKLKESIDHPSSHNYPEYKGSLELRGEISKWLSDRHNTKVNPEEEVLALIGSKEGIAHLLLSIINPGDAVVIASPFFPPYVDAATLAGGIPYFLPLRFENDFLPDFDEIPSDILKKTRLMLLNYPHNPTGAVATKSVFENAISLAKKYGFIICHDGAYLEIYQDEKPINFLSIDGAIDVGVELYSFSKTFNIAGWRMGFAAGNKEILSALSRLKMIVDSGQFKAIQHALIYAMKELKDFPKITNEIYKERSQILTRALTKFGMDPKPLKATFYIWAKTPKGKSSSETCKILLEKFSIASIPGNGFGSAGEGFVRFSLTQSTELIEKAAGRIVAAAPRVFRPYNT